ncbi:uncharacterized protein LOC110272930 [Arachis duranensis]|uniref:Uncharacterized protein LOC110272930 n=1 Tax=Arachis duranensis TaxID=130453 RepID=A0A6P5M7T6_ARADU|nr:uncharacterized protein LOC110272930 [Arachis duranensis]
MRIPEILAKFGDVVSSSDESNRNIQSLAMPGVSSSMPVGFSLFVPVIALELGGCGQPDAIKDVLRNDDDVESAMINDDTDDDQGRNISNIEHVILSVKTYSICRVVECKVLESYHVKYHEKCKEFGNGCRADAAVSIKILQNATEAHFEFRLTYRRILMVKEKTFPSCIEAFRHCNALVSFDGTHLYGKYRWTLMVAITQDRNSNIIHIAFALVEGENTESWSFFLSHFRQHVTPQPGILVILNKHNRIKAALEAPYGGWLPPTTYRTFCIRHVAANFALSFKGKDARSFLVNAAYAKTGVEFEYWFDIL